ncbi:tetratricopeptide repeat protein [Pseudodesulfovibrio sediminis]|uniref:Sel1 repeat family protein n=1 Tax=Pseudodesulfovibrio sediminis TaxID=2810563 RepID=A0ABN6ETU2_9BACT|nr:tetratricopeptide repeat protein [Pseudodesulfovibrio sediminis]BCS88464.1 hypothetical protein PSDVSF_17060 [Pseudodesulfovibrio sediminis]
MTPTHTRLLWCKLQFSIVILVLCVNVAFAGQYEDACRHMAAGEYAEAYRIYHSLSLDGDTNAQFNLGMMALGSLVGNIRKESAVFWLKLAADSGHYHAQYVLSRLYDRGVGTPVNKQAANEYRGLAAEGKDPTALYDLGMAYILGAGLPQDEVKGVGYIKESANLGSPYSILQLALFYKNGVYVTKDISKYRKLIKSIEMFDIEGVNDEIRAIEREGN